MTKYRLQIRKRDLFLNGFKKGEPIWVTEESDATKYEEMEALKLQRRLKNDIVFMIEVLS